MGREIDATVTFRGQTGACKLLLESDDFILRGDIRARFARVTFAAYLAEQDDLVIQTPQGSLRASIGAAEAARWVKALAKAPPSLADKLGIGPDRPVFVIGELTAPELVAATFGVTAPVAAAATVGLAELRSAADLDRARLAAGDLALWGITLKGPATAFSDAELRKILRAAGWIDTKSCAVSAELTATRYQRRKTQDALGA
jgi:hypothetical protein